MRQESKLTPYRGPGGGDDGGGGDGGGYAGGGYAGGCWPMIVRIWRCFKPHRNFLLGRL